MSSTNRAFSLIELLVVVAIIVILAAIGLTIMSGAKGSAKDTVAISNMRQLGQAAALYSETYGEWPTSCRYLVASGLAPKQLLVNPNDPTELGLGNVAVVGNYFGIRSPGTTPYRMSFGGFLEWEVSKFQVPYIKEAQGGGWLVDVTPSQKQKDARSLIFAEGVYRRVLFDTAVVARRHYSAIEDGKTYRSPIMLFADEGEKIKIEF